jgi:hypothetical protein
VNDKLEGSNHGLILRYYPSVHLGRLRKTMKPLSQYSQFLGWDLKPRPPEYEAEVCKFIKLCDTIMGDNMQVTDIFHMHIPPFLWTAYDANFKFKKERYKKNLIPAWHPRNTLLVRPVCDSGGKITKITRCIFDHKSIMWSQNRWLLRDRREKLYSCQRTVHKNFIWTWNKSILT